MVDLDHLNILNSPYDSTLQSSCETLNQKHNSQAVSYLDQDLFVCIYVQKSEEACNHNGCTIRNNFGFAMCTIIQTFKHFSEKQTLREN